MIEGLSLFQLEHIGLIQDLKVCNLLSFLLHSREYDQANIGKAP